MSADPKKVFGINPWLALIGGVIAIGVGIYAIVTQGGEEYGGWPVITFGVFFTGLGIYMFIGGIKNLE